MADEDYDVQASEMSVGSRTWSASVREQSARGVECDAATGTELVDAMKSRDAFTRWDVFAGVLVFCRAQSATARFSTFVVHNLHVGWYRSEIDECDRIEYES